MRIFCRQMVRTAWYGYNDFENREYKHIAVAERGDPQIVEEYLPIIEPLVLNNPTLNHRQHPILNPRTGKILA